MSFGDLERGYGSTASGSQAAFQPSGRGGDQEYIRINETIRGNVTRLSDSVSQYKKSADQMGTSRDTSELREKLHDLAEDIKELVKETTRDLKLMRQIDGGTPSENQQRRIQWNKLSSDFKVVLDRFQDTQKVVAEKERAFVAKAKRDQERKQEIMHDLEGERSDETQTLVQEEQRRQQQEQLAYDMEHTDAIITERAEGIEAIQRDMAELNKMMVEVGLIVQEQGAQVETIHENITSTAIQTKSGTEELVGASMYQRAARNKMCWILLICIIVLAIIIVVVVLQVV